MVYYGYAGAHYNRHRRITNRRTRSADQGARGVSARAKAARDTTATAHPHTEAAAERPAIMALGGCHFAPYLVQ